MMKASDNFFHQQQEPVRGTLLAMRALVLAQDHAITQEWKYGMPFFCFHGKMFCYLWVHKKYGQPYLGFVEGKHLNHSLLIQEKRSRMKILLLDPAKDLPVKTITALLQQALNLYREGIVKSAITKHT